MSKKNVKINLTGTYEEAMDEIDNASITDEFKDHLREEYHKVYDEVGQMISMESPTEIPSWVKLTQQSKFKWGMFPTFDRHAGDTYDSE